MLDALNFTCSKVVTEVGRMETLRPPSMFPISTLLSGTLITHFEGAASFVGHALSPVNFNDSNLSWPEVTTLQRGTILSELCGSLLSRIAKVGTLSKHPSIKFSL
jgi:hypothetical protein